MKDNLQVTELYQIAFPNGKKYIGISWNAKLRFVGHKRQSQVGRHTPLAAAFRKYGTKNAVMQILAIGHRDYILDLEIKAIELYQTRNREFGYNIARGGETSPVEGVGHTLKSRIKMANSQANRVRTEDELNRLRNYAKGRVVTEETKEKARQSAIKRWSNQNERDRAKARITDDQRAIMSERTRQNNFKRSAEGKYQKGRQNGT